MKDDVKSLSHSKWRCKYHIVFAPKYRRQIVYGQLKADIGKILRSLCERKGVNIISAECCPDHVGLSNICYTLCRKLFRVSLGDFQPSGLIGKLLYFLL